MPRPKYSAGFWRADTSDGPRAAKFGVPTDRWTTTRFHVWPARAREELRDDLREARRAGDPSWNELTARANTWIRRQRPPLPGDKKPLNVHDVRVLLYAENPKPTKKKRGSAGGISKGKPTVAPSSPESFEKLARQSAATRAAEEKAKRRKRSSSKRSFASPTIAWDDLRFRAIESEDTIEITWTHLKGLAVLEISVTQGRTRQTFVATARHGGRMALPHRAGTESPSMAIVGRSASGAALTSRTINVL